MSVAGGQPWTLPHKYGQYELLERIGAGGMAEVFRARKSGVAGFEKICVIKRILPHLAQQARFVNMFVNEAKLAAQLTHQNVVQVFELASLEGGELFIAMEYVPGTDLRKMLHWAEERELHIPTWFAVHSVREILGALAHAHDMADGEGRPMQVIHRDVTPANVFVSNLGEIKLADFGIAKAIGDNPETEAGQVKGNVGYMSPEALLGEDVDVRTDIFSAGVVLWETLTQQRLFHGRSNFETARLICDSERPAPSQFNPEVPPQLDLVVLQALEAKRDRRFSTAAEFQSSLVDILATMHPRLQKSHVREVVEVLSGKKEPTEEYKTRKASFATPKVDDFELPMLAPDYAASYPSARPMPGLMGRGPQVPPVVAPGVPGMPIPGTSSFVPQSMPSSDLVPSAPDVWLGSTGAHAVPPQLQQTIDDPIFGPMLANPMGMSSGVTAPSGLPAPSLGTPSAFGSGPLSPGLGAQGLPLGGPLGLGAPNPLTTSSIGIPVPVLPRPQDAKSGAERILEAIEDDSDPLELAHASPQSGLIYIRDDKNRETGPFSVEELLGGRGRAIKEVSANRRDWLDARTFAQLSGLDRLSPNPYPLRKVTIVGKLEDRSLVSVFGQLAQEQVTGRLVVMESGPGAVARREIYLVRGAPTFVYSDDIQLQLPKLLVKHDVIRDDQVNDLIVQVIRRQEPILDLISWTAFTDMNRYWPLMMRDRLAEMFRWGAGRFAFDAGAEQHRSTPFAKSLYHLVVEAVNRSYSIDELQAMLGPRANLRLRRADHFNTLVAKLNLSDKHRASVERLGKKSSIAQVLKKVSGPESAPQMAMGYVLLELGVLVNDE
ncbi:MAG: protein kinase [Deltaproteobacteria bacterium]|nr:protein kinase [Deltaproteobacteria bacterium]